MTTIDQQGGPAPIEEGRPQVHTWMAEDAAERWQRIRALRTAGAAAATNLMLDLAGVKPGSRVLDVAAGTGDQSIDAAMRVGPTGYVLATDLSAGMLKAAAEAAREAGLTNVETRVADCQELDLEPESFDAAICRFGLMFFPDRHKALGCVRRALKPAGKFAAIVWAAAEKNPWLSIPTRMVEQHGGTGATVSIAWSMGKPGLLENELASGGFRDIAVRPAPVNLRFGSLDEATEALKSAPAAEAIAQLPEDEQARVWPEIQAALRLFEGPNGYRIPGEALVGVGIK